MKINTDGVLLGGSTFFSEAKRILDIGTGTGVIALMLAQNHPNAHVDAVEIEEDAWRQAGINIRNSEFTERLAVHLGSFEHFQPEFAYDLIVSNPPFIRIRYIIPINVGAWRNTPIYRFLKNCFRLFRSI